METTKLPIEGLTFKHVVRLGDEAIVFLGERNFVMYHMQDCCESVDICDVNGELADLEGTPIVVAEERTSDAEDVSESGTWTFYTLRTIRGSVDIRWLGTSNGCYSEGVSVVEEPKTGTFRSKDIDSLIEQAKNEVGS